MSNDINLPRVPLEELTSPISEVISKADDDVGITAALLTLIHCDGQASTTVRGFCTPEGFAVHAKHAAEQLAEWAQAATQEAREAALIENQRDGMLVIETAPHLVNEHGLPITTPEH